eukprot:COSAG06_NODE_3410_length_5383_cov_180.550530_3_plen_62_part_00
MHNRDPYIAKPSRLIAPEDERAMLDKLLNDPRGERMVRRQRLFDHFLNKNDHFARTGSGRT